MVSASLTNGQVWTQFAGSSYDAARPPYPPGLLGRLIDVHRETAGGVDVALDLGCGPGTITRPLGASFRQIHGVDISPEMYKAAKPVPNVVYHTGSASDLGFLPSSSVDLVTAATSAHWFDHAAWWKEMSRVVRPSGTVAVFCYNPGFLLSEQTSGVVPPSLKELIDTTRLYGGIFTPFRTPGNGHTFRLYDLLPGPEEASDGWEPARRWRWGWKGKEDYGAVGDWDWDVQPAVEGTAGDEIEQAMESEISLADLTLYFASVSPILKYRAALSPGDPDWITDKLAAVVAEAKAQGEEWGAETKIKVRRVLGLVVWKRKA